MKRRSTFFHEGGGRFDPQQLSLSSTSLTIRELDAARQERFTFDIDEAPNNLRKLLEQCHELHIRWASQTAHDAIGPFSSRISPGLHVQLAPRSGQGVGKLCQTLKEVFSDELKCSRPEKSFTPVECHPAQGCNPALLQYYQLLPTLDDFIPRAQLRLCHREDELCKDHILQLSSADSLDIDFDDSSNTVKVTSFWSKPFTASGLWNEEIEAAQHGASRAEVGVLALQQSTQAHKLSVGGFLATIGEHEELKSSLFSFASRHHPLPESATFTVQFLEPTGLHPTMQISLPPDSLQPPDPTCSLHTYLTLPSTIFPDQYQLKTKDTIYRASNRWHHAELVAGELDLEAPDWRVEKWGSNVLIELADPTDDELVGGMHVTVPLHLRYLQPAGGGYRNISVPWPVVFWACAGSERRFSPFDRQHLGYDDVFGPDTLFYHVHPLSHYVEEGLNGDERAPLVEGITVPVLDMDAKGKQMNQARFIKLATVVIILAGFAWVLYKLRLVFSSSGARTDGPEKEDKKTI
ncbi:protease B nonderepressible form [Ascosphaera pollenicola]|nr:protease B nonderepressible form [Ascosphaera pollenicola]